jgi:hypothetical protein
MTMRLLETSAFTQRYCIGHLRSPFVANRQATIDRFYLTRSETNSAASVLRISRPSRFGVGRSCHHLRHCPTRRRYFEPPPTAMNCATAIHDRFGPTVSLARGKQGPRKRVASGRGRCTNDRYNHAGEAARRTAAFGNGSVAAQCQTRVESGNSNCRTSHCGQGCSCYSVAVTHERPIPRQRLPRAWPQTIS